MMKMVYTANLCCFVCFGSCTVNGKIVIYKCSSKNCFFLIVFTFFVCLTYFFFLSLFNIVLCCIKR
jgi:hypothetical protein